MNLFAHYRAVVISAVEHLIATGELPAGLALDGIAVEPPRESGHGDIATNAALVLAKAAKLSPRAIADKLGPILAKDPSVVSADIAGPGFINLRLIETFWHDRLRDVLGQGPAYGDSALGRGVKINVEYVSANPTGPLHIGHCRGAVFGDALANLLEKASFAVTREYYVNDAGAQLEALARSVNFRYREALGTADNPKPEGFYPGNYLIPVGKRLAEREGGRLLDLPEYERINELGWGVGGWREECANFGRDEMMALIRDDLADLDIAHDVFTSEAELHRAGKVQAAVEALAAKGLIYRGILEPPKGKKLDDWEPREQDLFRSTQFGDDVDRPLQKSDGSWTYFAADIAYHFDKQRRGFNQMIDVWGADHGGYVKRVQAAVRAISDGQAALDVKVCQLVNLLDGGEPVKKMSKRAGSFVTLRDVVEQVGRDVVRFIMLTRKNDAALDFDFQKVTEQSKDNPIFYVQYAHARAQSVLRNARDFLPSVNHNDGFLAGIELVCLTHPAELALIKLLATWPRQVETAAAAHEPHRVAFYLQDLAAAFHGLWNLGNEDSLLRFIRADAPALTLARLALVRGVALVIESGLNVIGVEAVEEMR